MEVEMVTTLISTVVGLVVGRIIYEMFLREHFLNWLDKKDSMKK